MAEVKKKPLELSDLNMDFVWNDSNNVMPGVGQMVAKVWAQKKISVKLEDVVDSVEKMYSVIKYFNSIDEYTTLLFGGVDIKEVKVLKEFADFIVPSAVRFDPTDLRSKNLAVQDGVMGAPLKYIEYVNLCDQFRSFFKKDASSDVINLVDKKKSVTLNSIIDQASNIVDGVYRVNYGTSVFYPIRLTDITVLYEDRHFNANESDLVSDYLSNFRF